MQRGVLRLSGVLVAAVLGLILLLWATGGLAALEAWVLQAQRAVQDRLAGAVRAIKTGQAGAVWLLLSVCFGYGVLHAAGPGHGKLLIGGYGIGRRVPFWSLSALSLLASLAQAGVAVALVYAGVAVLGWTREAAQGVAEDVMAPIGTAAIAGVGLWLMLRGVAQVRAQGHGPDGHHHHDADCGCGHAHGPSAAQVEQITGWRDAAALIAGIALRPCTGALFLLILTWQVGIGLAGIAGAFAMGLGTAVVTVAVAALVVWAREGALASLPTGGIARVLPWLQVLAGGVVAVVALMLLVQAL